MIQLPNQTNQIVAGVIDGTDLVHLLAAPQVSSCGTQITIAGGSDSKTNFLSVVPSQNTRATSNEGAVLAEDNVVIHSTTR